MTDKEKLSKIRFTCLTYIGDKNSMAEKIMQIIDQKKPKKDSGKRE